MTLSVSIIIPAYNAEKTLSKCLDSIFSAISSSDEVIVVNDASTDQTVEIVKDFNCQLINLPINNGAAHARNFGARNAKGDLIVFVDSDILITKENLENVRQYLIQNESVHSLTMNVISSKTVAGFFTDFKNLYMNSVISEGPKSVNYIYGSFCATRKTGFVNWPENLRLTEDSLWGFQQKSLDLEIHCLKNVEVTHLKEYSLLSLIKNDFLISSYFSRSFLEFSRWKTLYTKESFGHTSKSQKLSVLLCLPILAALFLNPLWSFFLLSFWFVINAKFFYLLRTKRGLLFTVGSMAWYYLINLVYVAGIFYGAVVYFSQGPRRLEREIA